MCEEVSSLFSQAATYGVISFSLLLAKEKGILDTLIAADHPMTSHEIATENRLKERFTREILGCLSSTKVTRATPRKGGGWLYDLTPEVKDFLSHGASLEFMNFVKIVMENYDDVSKCVDADTPAGLRYKGVYYDGVDETREKTNDGTLDFMLKNVPGLQEKLESGIRVVEFGCGRGMLLSRFAARFPASQFTASEVRADLVDDLKSKFSHVPNMTFDQTNLCVPPPAPEVPLYDWALMVDVVHDLPHPATALTYIRRLIRPDGVLTFVDMAGTGSHSEDAGNMQAAKLYALSTFLCLPESFQQEDSEAHGAAWGKDTALALCEGAGFKATVLPMDGLVALYTATPA